MSYCRWSSDNFMCQLYCYEDASGGWTTHVASSRIVGDVPSVDWSLLTGSDLDRKRFTAQRRAQSAFLDTADREPIGLPYDGKTFHDPTLEAFRDRLIMLRDAGYRFPASVIDDVEEEMREAAA